MSSTLRTMARTRQRIVRRHPRLRYVRNAKAARPYRGRRFVSAARCGTPRSARMACASPRRTNTLVSRFGTPFPGTSRRRTRPPFPRPAANAGPLSRSVTRADYRSVSITSFSCSTLANSLAWLTQQRMPASRRMHNTRRHLASLPPAEFHPLRLRIPAVSLRFPYVFQDVSSMDAFLERGSGPRESIRCWGYLRHGLYTLSDCPVLGATSL